MTTPFLRWRNISCASKSWMGKHKRRSYHFHFSYCKARTSMIGRTPNPTRAEYPSCTENAVWYWGETPDHIYQISTLTFPISKPMPIAIYWGAISEFCHRNAKRIKLEFTWTGDIHNLQDSSWLSLKTEANMDSQMRELTYPVKSTSIRGNHSCYLSNTVFLSGTSTQAKSFSEDHSDNLRHDQNKLVPNKGRNRNADTPPIALTDQWP